MNWKDPVSLRQVGQRRGWVHADMRAALRKYRNNERSLWHVITLTLQDRPFLVAASLHFALLTLSIVAKFLSLSVMPSLAPKDASSALNTAWQVHAGFVAIAFAGLAILFQTSSPQQVLSPERLRSVLFRRTYFSVVLAFCIIGAAGLGIVTSWFPSDGALLIQVLAVVITSMLAVGAAYFHATKALTQPDYAEGRAEEDLMEMLRDSLDASRAAALANNKLAELIAFDYFTDETSDHRTLVRFTQSVELQDVHLPTLLKIAKQIQDYQVSHTVGKKSDTDPTLPAESERPVLRIRASIGAMIPQDRPLFVVRNATKYSGSWEELENRLTKAVRTDNEGH